MLVLCFLCVGVIQDTVIVGQRKTIETVPEAMEMVEIMNTHVRGVETTARDSV